MRLLCFLMMLLMGSLYAQETSFKEFSDATLFNGKGLILQKDYYPKIQLPPGARVIDISSEQAYIAELIFQHKFSLNTQLTCFRHKNIRKLFWNYNRQYSGFISRDGDVHVMIQLLNFKRKKRAEEKFEGWEQYYFTGFGRFYEKNTLTVVVDLRSCTVSLW